MKLTLKILGGLLVVTLLVGAGGAVWLRGSLPQTEGEIVLEGLAEPVQLIRDRHSVPHIMAQNADDLYFAIGFAHAQDRLWQMEFNRRVSAGRLSELLGKRTLGIDRFFRTLAFHRLSKQAFYRLDPATRAMLSRYADGVNAFLTDNNSPLPPEFIILNHRPEPWTTTDSLAWLKMMALDLGGNMGAELQRADLSRYLSPEKFRDYFQEYPGDDPLPLPDLSALYAGIDWRAGDRVQEATLTAPRPDGYGSNNWVVDGTKTASGKPLLANDPHLGLTMPSIWYMAHLSTPGRNAIGYTLPGVPFVVLGRNDRVAWGFTNTAPDVQDLYFERLVGTDRYQGPDGPIPFITHDEIIRVRGGEDVVHQVRETRHGPVISDARSDIASQLPPDHVVALRWTALDIEAANATVGRKVMSAGSFEEFDAALADYVAPQQNMVFADIDGNIGYIAPGRIPVRAQDNEAGGLVPALGWKARFDWQGMLPYSAMPRRYNPQGGIIATANEKIVGPDYPHHLTHEWSPPYRGDRIRSLLQARDDHTIESFRAIQLDWRSGMAADLLPLMLRHARAVPDDVRASLAAWDYTMTVDSGPAAIFHAWQRALTKALYEDDLGPRFDRYRKPSRYAYLLQDILNDPAVGARWCDNNTTPALESCADAVDEAYRDADAWLTETLGADRAAWRWGDIHHLTQDHRPFGAIPVIGGFFKRSTPVPGSQYTVGVAGNSFSDSNPHSSTFGASMRSVYDLADLDRSTFIIASGQSGNPLSRHYDDLMPLWLEGRSVTIPSRIDAIEDPRRLILKPS